MRDDSIQALTFLKDPVDIFKGIIEVNYEIVYIDECIYFYV